MMIEIFGISIYWWIFGAIVTYVSWALYTAFWRIYLSPLSHIPGPKLAIATSWYECYYDVFKQGLYHKKVREFHKKYGIVQAPTTSAMKPDLVFQVPLFASTPTRQALDLIPFSTWLTRSRFILKIRNTTTNSITITRNGTNTGST
jgi:hypothetical protein